MPVTVHVPSVAGRMAAPHVSGPALSYCHGGVAAAAGWVTTTFPPPAAPALARTEPKPPGKSSWAGAEGVAGGTAGGTSEGIPPQCPTDGPAEYQTYVDAVATLCR